MHDNEVDQQGKEKIRHPWKPGCSKWCTTWIKEEINPEEANGSDGEDVFYKLPGAKKRQAKNKHNLMNAVTNVRGAEKKH